MSILWALILVASFVDIDGNVQSGQSNVLTVYRSLNECRSAERQHNIRLLVRRDLNVGQRAVCVPVKVIARSAETSPAPILPQPRPSFG